MVRLWPLVELLRTVPCAAYECPAGIVLTQDDVYSPVSPCLTSYCSHQYPGSAITHGISGMTRPNSPVFDHSVHGV